MNKIIRPDVHYRVWELVSRSIYKSVEISIWDSVSVNGRMPMCNTVDDSVKNPVRNSVRNSVCYSVKDFTKEKFK
jgi:hypothetical protein